MPAFDIRVATPADAAALLDVYAPYVRDTAITFEYEVPSVEEFANRIRQTLERYPYLVAVQTPPTDAAPCDAGPDDCPRILGYAYAGPFHARPAYDWAVETSIYVRQGIRRAGVGRALHEALEHALTTQGILNMEACIAYPPAGVADEYLTLDSVRFHEHMGYRMVGRFERCGYKFGHWYDMVWMERHIGKHVANPLPVHPFDPASW